MACFESSWSELIEWFQLTKRWASSGLVSMRIAKLDHQRTLSFTSHQPPANRISAVIDHQLTGLISAQVRRHLSGTL